MDIFQNNLELWSSFYPREAVMLPYVDTEEWSLSENHQNLKQGDSFLYDVNPANEANEWFFNLPKDELTVLFVYGVGLGFYFDVAKEWLEEDQSRCLVFLEDDPALLSRFFETKRATTLLKHPQVRLCLVKDVKKADQSLQNIYWNALFHPFQFSVLNYYRYKKAKRTSELENQINYDMAHLNNLVSEYIKLGVPFFRNFYPNILMLARSYLGNCLFGQFKGVPAIICGAGPSLKKNVHLLKDLQDKALIFAGGSALVALDNAGITPHFAAGIDPNVDQLDRIEKLPKLKAPFFYRNRLYHPAFKKIQGPRLYVTGSGGYDVSEWYEEKLGIESEKIKEGHNVINFCLEIAQSMGCDPLILVGMDLAYTDQDKYAPGVVKDQKVSDEDLEKKDDMQQQALEREDINGNPVMTTWKWVREADWISEFAKEYSGQIINATEGGIGIPGVQNVKLSEVSKKLLSRKQEFTDKIKNSIATCEMTHVTDEKVRDLTLELRASLVQCIEHFDSLLHEAQKMRGKAVSNDHEIPESAEAALTETQLVDEPGFKHVLLIFNTVISKVLNVELQRAQIKEGHVSQIKKIDLNIKRFEFLKKVAKTNIEIIDYAFNQQDGN